MKTTRILLGLLVAITCVLTSQAQMTSITIEETLVHPSTDYADGVNLDGYTTYRLYANLTNPNDFVSAVFGVDTTVSSISTTGEFWNSNFGGVSAENINEAAFGFVPSLEWDTYVTIGKIHSASPGQSIFVAGEWISSLEPGNGAPGSTVTMDGIVGGSWFTIDLGPDDSVNGYAGDDLKVLLGQFTTDGIFSGNLWVQVFPNGNSNDPQEFTSCFSSDGGNTPGCTDPESCTYQPEATCDNGSCLYFDLCGVCGGDGIDGCTDELACNYDPEATCSIAIECCYDNCGCTLPNASNYDSQALCENGSCLFGVSGVVYYDENENGSQDGMEYGLPFQEVVLQPMGWIALTNDDGQYVFNDLAPGEYTIEISPSEVFPIPTTSPSTNLLVEYGVTPDMQSFGVSDESPEYQICVDFYPNLPGYPCNDWVNHNICYRNEGNVPIDGVVEVEYNPLFQDYQEVTPIDSVVDNHIYMSFQNLLPGQMFFYDVKLLTPTVDYIGEFITSVSRVYGFYEDVQVAFGQESLTLEMTCSYDPNDKQVFPNGYDEPHFILNETELEYLVRFQNTGNAAATNVLVTDTIDENLDLETFQLMANSHSVMTTIRPEERVIEFFFENIMLPDSTTNEPESHGLVSYFITPYPDLAPGTVLNNTGNIYFDNNPPIITNTTWNTIFECTDELATIEPIITEACGNDPIELAGLPDYIEEYTWYIPGGEIVGTEQVLNTGLGIFGEIEVMLMAENPLCVATSTTVVTLAEYPVVNAPDDAAICLGESFTIETTSEVDFQWEGFAVNESPDVVPSETTTYTASTAANEAGCEGFAEVTVTVNPLPEINAGEDTAICSGNEITLSASGGAEYDWDGLGTGSELTVSLEEETTYTVTGWSEFDCANTDEVTVSINPNPEANAGDDVEICAGDEVTLTASGGDEYDWDGLGTASMLTVSPEETTSYSVTVWNAFQCSDEDEVEVTVNALPDASFSQDGNALTATAASSYQWYLDGVAIEGATNQTLEITEDGNYSVQLTNEWECSATSDETFVVYTGIHQHTIISAHQLTIYPNPASEAFTIQFPQDDTWQLNTLDSHGKLVYFETVNGENATIETNDWASGLYHITVRDSRGRVTHSRLMKQ